MTKEKLEDSELFIKVTPGDTNTFTVNNDSAPLKSALIESTKIPSDSFTGLSKDELLKWDFKNLIFIEPLWKLIMSNKAILPLLWEMFPNHPNLVPAYYDSPLK